MGTDVWSEKGVIVKSDKMINLVNDTNINAIKSLCISYYEQNIGSDIKEDEWDDVSINEYFGVLKKLNDFSLKQVKEALNSIIQIEGSPAKYDTSITVRHSDTLLDLFSYILENIFPKLPKLIEVRAFGSGRFNGYNVPLGVACFVFDDSSCFKQTLTTNGKEMSKIFGHCDITEWTIVSY